jgi:hypothetical protein
VGGRVPSDLGTSEDNILALSIASIPCALIDWIATSEVRCTTGPTDTSLRGPVVLNLTTGGNAVSIQLFNYRLRMHMYEWCAGEAPCLPRGGWGEASAGHRGHSPQQRPHHRPDGSCHHGCVGRGRCAHRLGGSVGWERGAQARSWGRTRKTLCR